jgi:hypothetical protein
MTMSILTGGLIDAKRWQQESEGQLRGASADTGRIEALAREMLNNPLYRSIIAEASSPDNAVEGLLREGALDTAISYDKAMDAQQREMGRMGVSPASGRGQALMQQWALARAAAEAGARTRARRASSDMSWQKKLQGFGAMSQAQGQAAGVLGNAFNARRALAGDYGEMAGEAGADSGYAGAPMTVTWGPSRKVGGLAAGPIPAQRLEAPQAFRDAVAKRKQAWNIGWKIGDNNA